MSSFVNTCTTLELELVYINSEIICYYVHESFSERVAELTHPELPIYSFELYSWIPY